jgi:Putative ATPase subunit of terminase (gpP-like)
MENNETTKPNTKPDREAVRVLAIELGAREAARRLGLNEDTVCSWARRYKWNLPQRKNGRPGTDLASTLHARPGDVLLAEHKSLETRTKSALARATVAAAEHVSTQPPLEVQNPAQLRDLATSAARLFGWDSDKPGVQLNQQFVISQEQLEQIRQLRGVPEPEELQERKNNEH